MIKFAQKTKKETAQTMVEFALVFPLLLVITYGLIEFGRMLFIYIAVTNSAREAARYGAALGDRGAYHYNDCTGINAAAQRSAILTDVTVSSIRYENPNLSTAKIGCPVSDTLIKRGSRIRVTVTANFVPLIPMLGLNQNPVVITRTNARTILMNIQVVPKTP